MSEAVSNRCIECDGPREHHDGKPGWCAWCDSIETVGEAQKQAFSYHDQTIAQQAARNANTYRSNSEINPAWIAGIVVMVMLIFLRVTCR